MFAERSLDPNPRSIICGQTELCAFLLLLLLQVCVPSYGQSAGQGVTQKPEVEVRVAQALDLSASMGARVSAYEALLGLRPEERVRGLLQVLSSEDDEFSAMAASQLIRYRFANIRQMVDQKIPKWSDASAALVLGAIRERGNDPALLDISRTILSVQLKRYPNGRPSDRKANPALMAALSLNHSERSDDKDLVRKLITQNPYAAGSWLIVLVSRQADDREIALAKSVYLDLKVSSKARVLAAAVAAKKDKTAAEFALKEISEFISRYRDQDDGLLFKKAYSSQAGRTEYLAFHEQLLLVCILRYFDTEAAERLTLNGLQSKNLLIRIAAGVVAATRWPVQLLESGQGMFSDDEYLTLLAFASRRHPQLAGEIMKQKFDHIALDDALKRLRQYGATSIFPIGTILFDY